jgi:predicted nucleic acid-binding protein
MAADPGGFFFDTNVIVYAYDATALAKQKRARATIEAAMKADRFVISTQVMQEFYNVAARRRLMSAQHAAQLLRHLAEHTVVPANAESVLRALSLQQRHTLSVWDALIVQAALDANCAVLYSEDLQDGRRFDVAGGAQPALQVVNPFNDAWPVPTPPAVHEPRPSYRVAAKKRRA